MLLTIFKTSLISFRMHNRALLLSLQISITWRWRFYCAGACKTLALGEGPERASGHKSSIYPYSDNCVAYQLNSQSLAEGSYRIRRDHKDQFDGSVWRISLTDQLFQLFVRNSRAAQLNRVYGPRNCNSNKTPLSVTRHWLSMEKYSLKTIMCSSSFCSCSPVDMIGHLHTKGKPVSLATSDVKPCSFTFLIAIPDGIF